jgi:hypothetical protein
VNSVPVTTVVPREIVSIASVGQHLTTGALKQAQARMDKALASWVDVADPDLSVARDAPDDGSRLMVGVRHHRGDGTP